MAHFAELDKNNIVVRVVVIDNYDCLADAVKAARPELTRQALQNVRGDNVTRSAESVKWEDKDKGKQLLHKLFGTNTLWVKTSYNGTIRKNYAGIGYTYDKIRDAFLAPKPYVSWVLNETSCQWEAPIQHPDNGKMYNWNEEKQSWDLIEG
jgi:hypothetical protein